MESYQYKFIEFAYQQQALQFGSFVLKSGRKSPYFFNTGCFNTGESIAKLGYYYAKAIHQYHIDFDMLFGPAYKGIPLVTATAAALSTHFGKNIPFCSNRKEVKDHGEGGDTMGAPLKGKILLVDDVITAGTAFRQSMELIASHGAKITAILIALDRQEKNNHGSSTIAEIQQKWGISVYSIIKLTHLMDYLRQKDMDQFADKINLYQRQYGYDGT